MSLEENMRLRRISMAVLLFILLTGFVIQNPVFLPAVQAQDNQTTLRKNAYACEDDLIEIMFIQESRVRMRRGTPTDLAGNALEDVNKVLGQVRGPVWMRICGVPEAKFDEIHARGEANTGQTLYNLNNIYRLKIDKGQDIWQISADLEALPGIMLARPVPKPMALPYPTNYQPQQNYEDPASSTPTGIDAEYAWTQTGGTGSGITVCDLEYGWNTSHQDLTKLALAGCQINPNAIYLPTGETDDHGTAVTGVLSSDNNGWGTTGICYGANLKTCGTYYYDPGYGYVVWNVPGAIGYAIAALSAGDVILLEQQWDYSDPGTAHYDFIPIEWWLNYHPNDQSNNGVYVAIQNAIAVGIHVVEAGGNGGAPHTYVGINTEALNWYGNSGAIIVGAGGAYPGGTPPAGYPEDDLEKINFSSYGPRFDLQGWGENVVTCGYNDLHSSEGKDLWYTSRFAGTSSASPIVAGAIACVMSYGQTQGWSVSTLTPSFVRNLLVNTGTPQITPPTGHIGPRPDLLAAFQQLAQWADVSASPHNDDGKGCGVAWGDYDGDGDPDIYIANYAGHTNNKLLRNDGASTFTDVTSGPLGDASFGQGVAWADYDNDGDLDLYLGNTGGNQANKLFRNDGGGVFTDASTSPVNDIGNTVGLAWGDYNNDGYVDIYVNNGGLNHLFHNDGDGTFTDVTSSPIDQGGNGTGVAWGDYDNDGDLDLYQCNSGFGWQNHLFRNDGGGTFTDVTTAPLAVTTVGPYAVSRGAAWGDYDNDGDLDLYVTTWAGSLWNRLFRNDGGGAFTDVTTSPLDDNGYGAGVAWGDYDNDGDLDIFVANGGTEGNKLFRNDGGAFTDATVSPLDCPGNFCYGAAFADHDGDGDLDLYITDDEYQNNKLFRNNIGSANHWLHIKLIGTVSNAAAIGARVKITTGAGIQIREVSGGSGYCSQNSLIVEFGLGSYTTVDQIEVTWPSGIVQTVGSTAADQKITITESDDVCDCEPGEVDETPPINILDIVYLINHKYKGGAAPAPYALCNGDPNCDCTINILDIVHLINYKYKGGTAPCDCDTWVANCGSLRK